MYRQCSQCLEKRRGCNNNNNNDHFLSANSWKALRALQNTRFGSGLVYTQISGVHNCTEIVLLTHKTNTHTHTHTREKDRGAS